ncbi:hypothetical protein I8752_36535 [Nostocaceae cyanobacterium CENA369]|uniref:Uncharacterized protein n=1 Tax=Dendronalium phyllosphericum CENA369 TaxID=1725256 RepID=A0A8J7IAP2_9NOST|nr:hypothetical protein [Dendronalium phyllosphericum]MBH8578354.1 hypothetical protein [Dendronalium phyllosphericum CENA369]
MGWKVEKRHSNTGKFVKGIRLRVAGTDDHIPTHDVYLMSRIKSDGSSDGSSDGLSDGSQPLLHKESDGCDGLNDKSDGSSDGLSDGSIDGSQPLLHIESDGCDGKTEVNFQLPCEEAPVFEVEQSQPALPEPIKVKINAPMGGIKAMATPIDCEKWSIHLMHPDATEYREEIKGGSRKVSNRLKALAARWQASVTYRVSRITQNGYEWVEGCKCVEANHTARGRNYIFESPAGESIQIYSERDIEIENKV